MENKSLSGFIPGFGLSFLVLSIINAILVIEKEANEGLKKWMAGLLGHHWVTHGVFIIILFFVLGWVFSRIKFNEQWYGAKTATIILIGAIIGVGIIVLSPLL
jgi:Ni/Fe-hydrogenase subunit HybB-like protein